MIENYATTQGPSEHLSWKELASKSGAPYPVKWQYSRAMPLSIVFEAIRSRTRPISAIRINSAYRPLAYNLSIGSKKNSQHVQGRALDLALPSRMSIEEFRDIALEVAHIPGSKLRGIGVYPWGIHIDIRPATRIARWGGTTSRA